MDLSHWLTDADACARLGLSARSLDREAKAGRLHPMNRPVEGRRPERVWNPEEIQARMPKMPAQVIVNGVAPRMSELAQAAQPMARMARETNEVTAPRTDLALPAPMMLVLEHFASMLSPPPPPPPPARWLTLKQGSARTGLSLALLRRLVREKRLPSIRDGAIKVLESDLDKLNDVAGLLARPVDTDEIGEGAHA